MRLLEVISRWMGRVEVVLAGADEELRAGEEALASGEPMLARALAHAVLKRLPGSLLGLALLADACEAAGLEAELALTLEDLAELTGSSAEVWLRLARARQKTLAPIDEVRDTLVRALAVAAPGSEARRDALFFLADLDLEQGDGARAELWLERLSDRQDEKAEKALRRAEARLLQNDLAGARAAIEEAPNDPTHGRAALTRGRILAALGDQAAFVSLIRAYVLEVPGASELLASTLAWTPSDEGVRARARLVVEHRGELGLTRWRAAFARAEGRRDEARAALRDAVAGGDHTAARPLLDAALDDGDPAALEVALGALSGDSDPAVADARKLPDPSKLGEAEELGAVLDRLATVTTERARPWAEAVRKQVALRWIAPSGEPAAWGPLLARLDAHAQTLHDLEATARISELSAERTRPVRVAIVGEFNAGKSTFINALMGADVAPTGVLPTTATLHHLRYAPDPIARISFEAGTGPERIVPVSELRATLKSIAHTSIRRVEILLPLPSLTRVEIIDTPGFNAPDVKHGEAARAAFREADAVVWLFDAGQALKQSERVVLDEAKAAHIPVQILVNKADRLSPADLTKVMERVADELRDLNIVSWTPPRALSARLALAGRLGDEQALAASGWAAVQTLLDEQIVGRSTELKERALRRRAAQVVAHLRGRAVTLADREHAEREGALRVAREMAHLSAALDRDAEEAAKTLAASLDPAVQAWQNDLAVVITGRDRETASADPVLVRYRVERALARIAPPLCDALAALASSRGGAAGPGISSAELVPLVRAMVRQLAFAGSASSQALARAAVATLIEHTFARATPKIPPGSAIWLERELFSFSEALG